MKSISAPIRGLITTVMVCYAVNLCGMNAVPTNPSSGYFSGVVAAVKKNPLVVKVSEYVSPIVALAQQYPVTAQGLLFALRGSQVLLSSDEHVNMYSAGQISPQCEQELRNLLYSRQVKEPMTWQIYAMNDYAKKITNVPYMLVTSSAIFVDETGFTALKRDQSRAWEYEALSIYLAQQTCASTYLKTSTSTTLSNGATWLAASLLIYGSTKFIEAQVQGTPIDSSLQSLNANYWMSWALWAASLKLSSYAYKNVQTYLQPHMRKPFDEYIADSWFVLDEQVARRLGDHAQGAVDLLAALRDSLAKTDARLPLIKKRIEALASHTYT